MSNPVNWRFRRAFFSSNLILLRFVSWNGYSKWRDATTEDLGAYYSEIAQNYKDTLEERTGSRPSKPDNDGMQFN